MSSIDLFFDSISKLDAKVEQAKALLWYSDLKLAKPVVSMLDLSGLFTLARLPAPNTSRMLKAFKIDREVTVAGSKAQLTRDGLRKFTDAYGPIFQTNEEIQERVDLGMIPFLNKDNLLEAKTMSQFYQIAHCLENSLRHLIEGVLSNKLGSNWWEIAASKSMKEKHQNRIQNEAKKKWAPARAEIGPLYSIDWSDLCTLMRKYETDFLPFIGEIGFLHRFEDLGELRNVIAHHGYFNDETQMKRLELACLDWIAQNPINSGSKLHCG